MGGNVICQKCGKTYPEWLLLELHEGFSDPSKQHSNQVCDECLRRETEVGEKFRGKHIIIPWQAYECRGIISADCGICIYGRHGKCGKRKEIVRDEQGNVYCFSYVEKKLWWKRLRKWLDRTEKK